MTDTTKRLKCPAGLDSDSKKLWLDVMDKYNLDEDGKALLGVACHSLSSYYASKEELSQSTLTFTTKSGEIRKNPLAKIEKDYLTSFLAALRSLNLSGPDDVGPGRPGGKGPN